MRLCWSGDVVTEPTTGGHGAAGVPSLEGLHGTVPVPPSAAGFWRQTPNRRSVTSN